MRFAEYLSTNGISDADFAARIGVTRQTVYRYRVGERLPDQSTMARIFEVTNGVVEPNDFFDFADLGGSPSPAPNPKEAA